MGDPTLTCLAMGALALIWPSLHCHNPNVNLVQPAVGTHPDPTAQGTGVMPEIGEGKSEGSWDVASETVKNASLELVWTLGGRKRLG